MASSISNKSGGAWKALDLASPGFKGARAFEGFGWRALLRSSWLKGSLLQGGADVGQSQIQGDAIRRSLVLGAYDGQKTGKKDAVESQGTLTAGSSHQLAPAQ